MHSLAFLLERYGLLVIFLNVLLVEAGLPLPCYPVLIAAAALAGGHEALAGTLATGCAALPPADPGWFWAAPRHGPPGPRGFCRPSLPAVCCAASTPPAVLPPVRLDRIMVAELRRLIDDGAQPVILDVRVHSLRAKEGVIPGSIFANPSELDRIVRQYPPDAEVIVYSACPNEASAAVAAQHLKRAGFKKIRPVTGRIEAGERGRHPVHYIENAKSASTRLMR